jgi:Bacterial Ig-like domain (group 2)
MPLLLVAACGGDDTTPTSPSPGTGTLVIAPQTDVLTVGASLVFEARLTSGTLAVTVVAADWSSQDGRVAAVDRLGRVTALAAGTTTLRAVFEGQTATLAVRVVPNFAGVWTGARRVTACLHPSPTFCATTYPPGRQFQTSLTLTQARDRVTGQLSLAPPAASPSAAVSGDIALGGQLALSGTIISTPATGAVSTLGTVADWRSEVDAVTPTILRGSFVEQRTDSDATQWRVSWELVGLTKP